MAIPRLKERYLNEVAPALQQEFQYKNSMQTPRLQKVVLNIGLGEALTNARALEGAASDLTAITGQHPVITRAKRSIAQFRVREGQAIGMMVTLRQQRMWDFTDRLVSASLPRIRDFRGIAAKGFDGRGNYNLGLREQIIFPEIEYDKVDRIRGLQVSVITTAKTDDEARRLLELLGFPFTKDN
jgi:large subunit ribosomal protein L5